MKIIATLLTATLLLTGCNTIQGLGKDISQAGEAISNTAHK